MSPLVVDTSALLAALDGHDRYHPVVQKSLESEVGRGTALLLPALTLAELDHFLRREGVRSALGPFLEYVAAGGYRIECPTTTDLRRARTLIDQYGIDLTDATVALVAERNGRRICTLDRRDFVRLRTATGKRFVLLPEDLS